MNITQEADYAIRTILLLSELGKDNKLNAQSIADKQKIPFRFLLKLLQKLKKEGIVNSYMGVNGGYALAHEPCDVSLLEVIEAIDGPIFFNRCLYDKNHCNRVKPGRCPVHNVLKESQKN